MSESQRLTCSICLETINESDEKVQCVRTPTGGCDNFFHKNCIVDYCKYDEDNVCPMCRDSRICDEIRSQRFEELPDWNTEYMLDEIATNFMRPPPTWPIPPGPRSIVNMRNLERMPLNILLQIRNLFEAEIEAQRRLIASTIPVTETQRQELEQRGELSIESINNRSTEIRRQLMIDITRIIISELSSRNLDAVDAEGARIPLCEEVRGDIRIPLREVVRNDMMGYSDSDSTAVPSQNSTAVPSQSDSESDSEIDRTELLRRADEAQRLADAARSDADAALSDAAAVDELATELRAIAAARAEDLEPQIEALDAAADATTALLREEEPELEDLQERIRQNDAEIARLRLRNQTNEQSSEAFDSERGSAEGGAPKIESPQEEQQFVENLSNLDILQTTQSTDSSGNIITKREPTFLGNENLVEENESKNANMKESYPLNKKHDKWTGDDDPNHDKKIKIFHNWLKNVFRKFKPNSPGLSIIFKGQGLRLETDGIFWWDWMYAENEDEIREIIDKIYTLSNENKKKLFVDLTIGTVLIHGYTHPDDANLDDDENLDLEFIFENIENWMHFVRRVESSPRVLSGSDNNEHVFSITIGKNQRQNLDEWDNLDNIIFSLEIRNLNYPLLLSDYESNIENDSESILTGRMSLIEAIHTFKLNMKRLLKIRNIRSDYIDLSKYISLGLFGGGDDTTPGEEEVDAANILLKIKDSKYTKKRSHKKRPDSPILLKNERGMYECPNCVREFDRPQAQIQHCKTCIKKKVGGNKKTRKRRFLLRNSQYKKY